MPHTLPELKYSYESLEPYIDAQTMEIHHTKHHKAYVDNLNKALETHTTYADMTLEELLKNIEKLPESLRTVVRNNAGGHYNHSMFWQILSNLGGKEPTENLMKIINETFGSFDEFKAEFTKAALSRFGSGWAWLYFDSNKVLKIGSTPNQDNPVMDGGTPILGLDVWEHAYYLKYQNKRKDYIDNWWFIVDWDKVEEIYNYNK